MSYYFQNVGFGLYDAGSWLEQQVVRITPPNSKFLTGYMNMGPINGIRKYDFEDFHEESNFGFFAVKLIRKINIHSEVGGHLRAYTASGDFLGDVESLTLNRVSALCVKIVNVDGGLKDLTRFKVLISRNKANCLQFATPEMKIGEHFTKKMTVEMNMFMIKSNYYSRYFPSHVVSQCEAEDLFNKIDRMLDMSFSPDSLSFLGFREFIGHYVVRTVGHVIYAMLLKKSEIAEYSFNNINLRLLLLCLSTLALCPSENRLHYLVEMYKWLVLDTCDSCVEKVFLVGRDDISDLYDLSSIGDASKPYWITEIRSTYKLFPHSEDMSVYAYSIPRMSHGAFVVSGLRDLATLHFVLNGEKGFEVRLNVAHAMMFRQIMSHVVRAVRSASYGHHDFLLIWFKAIYDECGSFDRITQYILDLVDLSFRIWGLIPCFKTLVLALFYGKVNTIIIYACLSSISAPCAFDTITEAILNSNPIDVGGVLGYLFNESVSYEDKKRFINSIERIGSLKNLCKVNDVAALSVE